MQDSHVACQSPRRAPAAPLSTEPVPCYPNDRDHACHGCARHRSGEAPQPGERVPIRIDASLFRVDGKCLMYAPVRFVTVVKPATALEQLWRAQA